jgi:hypothetical protein
MSKHLLNKRSESKAAPSSVANAVEPGASQAPGNTNAEENTVNTRPKKHTKLDLMLALVEMTCGSQGLEAFKREALPRLAIRPTATQEISEAEFQFGLAKMREELPAFVAFLRNHQFGPAQTR